MKISLPLALRGLCLALLIATISSATLSASALASDDTSAAASTDPRKPTRPIHPESADPMDKQVLQDRWGMLAELAGGSFVSTMHNGSERYRWIKPGLVLEKSASNEGRLAVFEYVANLEQGYIEVKTSGTTVFHVVVQANGDIHQFLPGFMARNLQGQTFGLAPGGFLQKFNPSFSVFYKRQAAETPVAAQ